MIRVLQVMGGMNRRGAESFIMNVYRKIDRARVQFDFLVYTDEKQDFEEEIESLGGRVIHMPCETGVKAFLSIPKFRRIIQKMGPYKVIHIQTLLNSAWPLLAVPKGCGVVRMVHSHNTHNKPIMSGVERLYEIFAKYIIRTHTQVMAACGEEAGVYLFGQKFRKGGIVINNGIDLDIHAVRNENAVDAIRKEYCLYGQLVIGSVARFNEVKNHPFMVQIAKVLKDKGYAFRMLFVGNGDGEKGIRQLVHDNDLDREIIFTGLRSDISDLMFTFDVFLMPSHFEGNPVTLAEAQAAGLPCVISNVITDKMDMNLGLINKCSLKDAPSVWADTIIKASKNRCNDVGKIRERFCICGYDAQTTANKLISIYEQ